MNHFTPGPWRACKGSNKDSCVCGLVWSTEADIVVAQAISSRNESATLGHGVEYDSEMFHANARLIAAAPELLEALEHMMQSDDSGGTVSLGCYRDHVRELIAKATSKDDQST